MSNKEIEFQCDLLQQENQIKLNYKTSEAVNLVAAFTQNLEELVELQ